MSKAKKELSLEFLASGLSVEKSSELAGVSRACIYKWLALEDFKNDLKERQKEYFSRLSKRLTGITLKALEVLEKSLDSKNESIRLRACGIALSSLRSVMELSDFEERISALENER